MVDSVSIDEAFLKKVQEAIEKNFADSNFGVEELALEVGISRAQLYRRLQSLTGKAANQMIREFRLEKAYELLQVQAGTISEIAYRVGFSSPSYFDACFKRQFGYQPGKVKPISQKNIQKRNFQSSSARYVSWATGLILILALVVFILSRGKDRVKGHVLDTETSIAVLPFAYLSQDSGDQYLAEAMMNEINFQLSYNQDLRVMPGISVDQYRSKEKKLKQIARELDVEYILDGSLQKQGDRVNVIVSLVNARTNRIAWTNKYAANRTDMPTIQSQIAQRIASELDIEITPEVKQIMEKIPNTSPDATDFYWRGNDELNHYNGQDNEALERADRLFHEALRLDSTLARAYGGLARISWERHYWNSFLSDDFADSMLILVNKALSFDHKLADAYVLKGLYYKRINNKEQALEEFDRAITLNPSSAEAYRAKAELYWQESLANRIENLHIAAELERGEDLPHIYRSLGWGYAHAGFKEMACNYIENAVELDGDSAAYFMAMSEVEHEFGDFKKSIDYGKKSYAIDSAHWWKSYLIGMNYSFLDNHEEYLKWLKRFEEIQFKKGYTISQGLFQGMFRLAHAYGINGFKEEANHYITEGLALYEKMFELDRHYNADIFSFYYMAALHAFQGDKIKAYEYLYQLNDREGMPLWIVQLITYDPMFDDLRKDLEFQQFVHDVESKYTYEHKSVRQWLEENDMI